MPSGRVRTAVSIKRTQNSRETETRVQIEDRFPGGPWFARGPITWHVTTQGQRLPSEHFGATTARSRIQATKHKKKERVIYAIQQREVVVGMSFHVDEDLRLPFIVTALAVRTDSTEARAMSLSCAGWLLAYLLEASDQDRRPHAVGTKLEMTEDDTDFRAIGFTSARVPPGLSLGGGRYLEMTSRGSDAS